jgi:hypothetical protein
MKTILLSLACMCLCVGAFAQTQKDYIEITASDSIHLRTISFNYVISLNEYAWSEDMDEHGNINKDNRTTVSNLETIKTELNRAGIKFRHYKPESNYSLPKQNQDGEKLIFDFASRQEITDMIDIVDKYKGLIGEQTGMNREPVTDEMMQKLYTKVYETAVEKAKMMAEASHRKLGKVISIVPQASSSEAPFNMFDNMFAAFSGGAFQDDNFQGISQMTCTFKFELID